MKAPKSKGGDFKTVPAGNHVARLYRLLHIGTVPEVYMGEDKMTDKIMLGFELPNEKAVFTAEKGEEPFVISREFTLSMSEKANLRKIVEGMLGTTFNDDEAYEFDVESLIGQTCLLNVVHKKSEKSGNDYALIMSASPLPKGMEAPAAYNKAQVLDYDKWNEDLFMSLPGFLKEKIRASEEYKKKGEQW